MPRGASRRKSAEVTPAALFELPEANWEQWVAIGTGLLALATFALNASQFAVRYLDRPRIATWITPRTDPGGRHSIIVQVTNAGGRAATLMGLGVARGTDARAPLLLDSVTILYSATGVAPARPRFPVTLAGGQVGQWYLTPRALVESAPSHLYVVDVSGKRYWQRLPEPVVQLIDEARRTPVATETDEWNNPKPDPYG